MFSCFFFCERTSKQYQSSQIIKINNFFLNFDNFKVIPFYVIPQLNWLCIISIYQSENKMKLTLSFILQINIELFFFFTFTTIGFKQLLIVAMETLQSIIFVIYLFVLLLDQIVLYSEEANLAGFTCV